MNQRQRRDVTREKIAEAKANNGVVRLSEILKQQEQAKAEGAAEAGSGSAAGGSAVAASGAATVTGKAYTLRLSPRAGSIPNA